MNVWLQISGLIVGFLGALILTVAEIQRRKDMDAQSATCFDYNPAVKKALQKRSNLAILATVLLIAGFLLQLFGTI